MTELEGPHDCSESMDPPEPPTKTGPPNEDCHSGGIIAAYLSTHPEYVLPIVKGPCTCPRVDKLVGRTN